jgi:glycosyltransferase involved in cell wall biosynthesis
MPEITLSILICSLHKRFGMLGTLLRNLHCQIEEANAVGVVEVLVNADGGEKSTGKKRNELIGNAKGEWVVFVDDDDEVANCYVTEILKALQSNPDAVGLSGRITTNGREEKAWFISKNLPYCSRRDEQGREYYVRFNNHLSPTRRSIAAQIGFPDVYVGEDYDYARRLSEAGLIKSEVVIEKDLYHYKFVTNKK